MLGLTFRKELFLVWFFTVANTVKRKMMSNFEFTIHYFNLKINDEELLVPGQCSVLTFTCSFLIGYSRFLKMWWIITVVNTEVTA